MFGSRGARIGWAVTRNLGGEPMQSSLDREIRDHLLDYLSGAATLEQFKDWLLSVT